MTTELDGMSKQDLIEMVIDLRSKIIVTPKKGDTVHIVGVPSWVGYTGVLSDIRKDGTQAVIALTNKDGLVDYHNTAFYRVRVGKYTE